jgi:hypothetical protein
MTTATRGSRALEHLRPDDAVRPSEWTGQPDCLVGPFPARSVAEAFAGIDADFGGFDAYSFMVLHLDPAWYLLVNRSKAVIRTNTRRSVVASARP